ncbi:hypothetical protein [Candidatus Ferrigenium straubiae]|jgi:ACR3 family arsenite transporter|uniref:hypothetical protein n=1 Tax=Candidatus Ferrigenium straubiae TaxID=2919506 RepID=UPI003F4AD6FC
MQDHRAIAPFAQRAALLQAAYFIIRAALATVVGVLIEVPVMLLVVRIANATQAWYGGAARE